jgi:flagellar motor switch/type III secretory pathway protein FliN
LLPATLSVFKLLANKTEIARGEVVIIEDNFGLRITQITKHDIGKK